MLRFPSRAIGPGSCACEPPPTSKRCARIWCMSSDFFVIVRPKASGRKIQFGAVGVVIASCHHIACVLHL